MICVYPPVNGQLTCITIRVLLVLLAKTMCNFLQVNDVLDLGGKVWKCCGFDCHDSHGLVRLQMKLAYHFRTVAVEEFGPKLVTDNGVCDQSV